MRFARCPWLCGSVKDPSVCGCGRTQELEALLLVLLVAQPGLKAGSRPKVCVVVCARCSCKLDSDPKVDEPIWNLEADFDHFLGGVTISVNSPQLRVYWGNPLPLLMNDPH